MKSSVFEKDSDLKFPHFTVLKASAGSGKTYALSHRFVQYLLSDRIPKNKLRNIVAMTFSNNAAKEMRERIILWLKFLALGEAKTLERFSGLVSLSEAELTSKAAWILDEILEQYTDFQVKTIDSFMTTIFKTSAVEFGYNPDFDIVLDNSLMIDKAFHRFLRRVAEGTPDAHMLESMIGRISGQKKEDASYLWDPCEKLIEEIKNLSRIVASRGKQLVIPDASAELRAHEAKIRECVNKLEEVIAKSGLQISRSSAYFKSDIPAIIQEDRFYDLVGRALKVMPANKPKSKDDLMTAAYAEIEKLWETFGDILKDYTVLHARTFYFPYISVFEAFERTIEEVKRTQGAVFIEDINLRLATHLDRFMVPDIYFRLGETINHFFMDEFQDTSPIQWKNLYPLLENALAEQGSIFVVGDTKQAIYGFRDADYKIMKSAEEKNPFPSADYHVRELVTNFRSCAEILSFNDRVFKTDMKLDMEYGGAAEESGLTTYEQHVNAECRVQGHVELHCMEKSDDGRHEKEKLREILCSLRERHYSYNDIAILTQQNDDAVKITSWLNERDIPFLSFSSLDIRKRKVTGEIIALLRFLDSPTDDLAFASFLLGKIFERITEFDCETSGKPDFRTFMFEARHRRPLYKAFQERYPDLWDRYLSKLFKSSGYFPLYDLVTQVYHVFRLFEIYAQEEATLIKLLETVKDFEGLGENSLGEFLNFAKNEESAEAEWQMIVPKTQDAVRVMTIHKAKGLGFRVAIIMLFEHLSPRSPYTMDDGDLFFSMLKITKDMAELDDGLGKLYEKKLRKELVNSLNSLYVGFSRPEEELYVIGITGRKEKPGFPLSVLPFDAFKQKPAPARSAEREKVMVNDMHLVHHHAGIIFPDSAGSIFSIAEKRRGDLMHAMLSAIEYLDGEPEQGLEDVIKKLGAHDPAGIGLDALHDIVTAFLRLDDIKGYFRRRPGRAVWNEKELADDGGRLYRLDRLVLDQDEITVIDYKTGNDKEYEDGHLPQMRNYLRLVRNLYPEQRAAGIIAYVDLMLVRRVS